MVSYVKEKQHRNKKYTKITLTLAYFYKFFSTVYFKAWNNAKCQIMSVKVLEILPIQIKLLFP